MPATTAAWSSSPPSAERALSRRRRTRHTPSTSPASRVETAPLGRPPHGDRCRWAPGARWRPASRAQPCPETGRRAGPLGPTSRRLAPTLSPDPDAPMARRARTSGRPRQHATLSHLAPSLPPLRPLRLVAARPLRRRHRPARSRSSSTALDHLVVQPPRTVAGHRSAPTRRAGCRACSFAAVVCVAELLILAVVLGFVARKAWRTLGRRAPRQASSTPPLSSGGATANDDAARRGTGPVRPGVRRARERRHAPGRAHPPRRRVLRQHRRRRARSSRSIAAGWGCSRSSSPAASWRGSSSRPVPSSTPVCCSPSPSCPGRPSSSGSRRANARCTRPAPSWWRPIPTARRGLRPPTWPPCGPVAARAPHARRRPSPWPACSTCSPPSPRRCGDGSISSCSSSPTGPRQAAGALVALVGIGLLALARGVRRGQRRAFVIAVWILAVSLVLHLARGGDVGQSVFALVVLAFLVDEPAASSPPSPTGRRCARPPWRSASASSASPSSPPPSSRWRCASTSTVPGCRCGGPGRRSSSASSGSATWRCPTASTTSSPRASSPWGWRWPWWPSCSPRGPLVDRRRSGGRAAEARARDIVRRHGERHPRLLRPAQRQAVVLPP